MDAADHRTWMGELQLLDLGPLVEIVGVAYNSCPPVLQYRVRIIIIGSCIFNKVHLIYKMHEGQALMCFYSNLQNLAALTKSDTEEALWFNIKVLV